MNDTETAPDREFTRELPIVNKRGLHARASSKFVQVAEGFDATVNVTRLDETVGATSIMGLMMLAAGFGSTITLSATGPDAERALAALSDLVENKFGEED